MGHSSNQELADADKTQPKFEVVGLSDMSLRCIVQPPHTLGPKVKVSSLVQAVVRKDLSRGSSLLCLAAALKLRVSFLAPV